MTAHEDRLQFMLSKAHNHNFCDPGPQNQSMLGPHGAILLKKKNRFIHNLKAE